MGKSNRLLQRIARGSDYIGTLSCDVESPDGRQVEAITHLWMCSSDAHWALNDVQELDAMESEDTNGRARETADCRE